MLPARMARMLARLTWSSPCAQTAVKRVHQSSKDLEIIESSHSKGQDMTVVEPEPG